MRYAFHFWFYFSLSLNWVTENISIFCANYWNKWLILCGIKVKWLHMLETFMENKDREKERERESEKWEKKYTQRVGSPTNFFSFSANSNRIEFIPCIKLIHFVQQQPTAMRKYEEEKKEETQNSLKNCVTVPISRNKFLWCTNENHDFEPPPQHAISFSYVGILHQKIPLPFICS